MRIKWKRKANIDIFNVAEKEVAWRQKQLNCVLLMKPRWEFEERRVSCGFSLSSSNMRHCEPVNAMTKTCSCCFFWIRVD